MKSSCLFFLFLLGSSLPAICQHLYQTPKPLQHKSVLEQILGPTGNQSLSREVNILWVYGYDEHHIPGAHDYVRVKDTMVHLLSRIEKVEVSEAFQFPNREQFERADLVVMYLHLPRLSKKQFRLFKNYVESGGSVIALHETAIMRPSSKGKMLSECLGFAWNEGNSKWGAIFDEISIDTRHPIFKGFPSTISIRDEFYWDLFREEGVDVLGSVRTGPDGDSDGPIPTDQLSENKSPVFWTYKLGAGKVFGTTTGHHTFTYFDPEFRIILFRAMAWALDVKPEPFLPLVFEGITSEDGMVGITDPMRYWEGKIRE